MATRKPIHSFAERMAKLAGCASSCGNESLRTSDHSPCVVQNEEELASCVSHPNHTTRDGKVTYKASDFAFLHGMSVTRLKYKTGGLASVIEYCKTGFCNERNRRDYRGVMKFLAATPRQILWGDGTRSFLVLDTAGPGDDSRGHADIVATRHHGDMGALPPASRMERQAAQALFFLNMVSVDKVSV